MYQIADWLEGGLRVLSYAALVFAGMSLMTYGKADPSRAGAKTVGLGLMAMAGLGLLGTLFGLVLHFGAGVFGFDVVNILVSVRQLFSGLIDLVLAGTLAFGASKLNSKPTPPAA